MLPIVDLSRWTKLGVYTLKKVIQTCFLDHPESVGESYFQHLLTASGFAARMIWGGLACFLHGLCPFICAKTGSSIINQLHRSMVTHRAKVTFPVGIDQQTSSAPPE